VWELLVHAAYWKYVVWRRLTGAARGSFPLEGSNFFERPLDRTAAAWRADLRLIAGAAAHDVYHAGQIQLLKKFHSRRRAGR
jgi:hypothetical protein